MEQTFWVLKLILVLECVAFIAIPSIFFKRKMLERKISEFIIWTGAFVVSIVLCIYAGLLGRDIVWCGIIVFCTGTFLAILAFKLGVIHKTLGMDARMKNKK